MLRPLTIRDVLTEQEEEAAVNGASETGRSKVKLSGPDLCPETKLYDNECNLVSLSSWKGFSQPKSLDPSSGRGEWECWGGGGELGRARKSPPFLPPILCTVLDHNKP